MYTHDCVSRRGRRRDDGECDDVRGDRNGVGRKQSMKRFSLYGYYKMNSFDL